MSGKNKKNRRSNGGMSLAEVDVINSNSFKQTQLHLERHNLKLTKDFSEQMLLHNREYSELKMFLQSIKTVEPTDLSLLEGRDGMSNRPRTAPPITIGASGRREKASPPGEMMRSKTSLAGRSTKFNRSVSDTDVGKMKGFAKHGKPINKTLSNPAIINKVGTNHSETRIKFNLPLDDVLSSEKLEILTPRHVKSTNSELRSSVLSLSTNSDSQSDDSRAELRRLTQSASQTSYSSDPRRPLGSVSLRRNLGLDDLDDPDDKKMSKSTPELRDGDSVDKPSSSKQRTSPRSMMPLKSPTSFGCGNLSVLVASQKQILRRRQSSLTHSNTKPLSPGECIEMQIKRREQIARANGRMSTFTPHSLQFSARRKSPGVRKPNNSANNS